MPCESGESCPRRGVRVRSSELSSSRPVVASSGRDVAGTGDACGTDGLGGGERDRCRGVVDLDGVDSGAICGIDGIGGAGGNGVAGGTCGSKGVAGGMAVEGWTSGSLSIRGANGLSQDGNVGGMLLGGSFMEGVASGRLGIGGVIVVRRGSGAAGGTGGGGRPVEGAVISSSGSCIDASGCTR